MTAFVILLAACERGPQTAEWSATERRQLQTLSLDRLSPPPPDPSNRHADDPRAAALGAKLFDDTRLSRNGQVSCASCHQAARHFSDGRARSQGIATTPRHAPGLEAVAWSRWQFWDGRADSLWAQAMDPLGDPAEHGLSRLALAQAVAAHYRDEYAAIFGPLAPRPQDPASATRIAVNAAKAIAAFERTLKPGRSRFDRYLAELDRDPAPKALTDAERRGASIFIGKGQCLRCHSGPLLTNQEFHNTGLASRIGRDADRGRSAGIAIALQDELNCAGPHSDARAPACAHLRYARPGAPEWLGAFKVPSLRNVARTAPYMHDGRFQTLEHVIDHYDRAPNPDGLFGHTELLPLALSPRDKRDLVAFLASLNSE